MAYTGKQSRLQKVRWPALLLGAAFWGFCLWLAVQIPYTHDDWDWGLNNGIQQLLSASINSRYAGNLLEVLLTRSAILKALVLGTTLFLLPAAAVRFSAGEKRDSDAPAMRGVLLGAGAGLLLTIRTSVWRQTCGWVAGFSNFVFSALLLGAYLIACSSLFESRDPGRCGFFRAAGLFALCFALQLFLENLTVYILGTALVFFISDWILRRHPSLRFGSMLAGAAAGAGVMFSSGMYRTLLSTGEAVGGYRQLTFDPDAGLLSIAAGFLKRFVTEIAPDLWENNHLLGMIVLTAMLCVLVIRRNQASLWITALLTALHICALVGWILLWSGWEPALTGRALTLFHAAVNGGLFLLVSLEVLIDFRKEPGLLCKLLGLWVSAPLVLLPMVTVNTIGPRSFFTSDFFLILFCLAVFSVLLRALTGRTCAVLAAVTAAVLTAVCLRWGAVYSAIGSVSNQRAALIAQARETGAETVTLPAYPYSEYLWMPDPANDKRVGYFKAFYGIPENVTVIFESKEEVK